MNMIILENGVSECILPPSDRRARHIVKILRKNPGDELMAGTPDGRVGQAVIIGIDDGGVRLHFRATGSAPELLPIVVLLGFPRPIQAGRIVKDLTSLGVSAIVLSGTELGEKSYFQSDFFKNEEYRAALLEGAEQAANPRLPAVQTALTLARALDIIERLQDRDTHPVPPANARWCLDPYRGEICLGTAALSGDASIPLALAVGSERGWTPGELDRMAERGFRFATLGGRILKTETAVVAAVSIALAGMGYL